MARRPADYSAKGPDLGPIRAGQREFREIAISWVGRAEFPTSLIRGRLRRVSIESFRTSAVRGSASRPVLRRSEPYFGPIRADRPKFSEIATYVRRTGGISDRFRQWEVARNLGVSRPRPPARQRIDRRSNCSYRSADFNFTVNFYWAGLLSGPIPRNGRNQFAISQKHTMPPN